LSLLLWRLLRFLRLTLVLVAIVIRSDLLTDLLFLLWGQHDGLLGDGLRGLLSLHGFLPVFLLDLSGDPILVLFGQDVASSTVAATRSLG